MTEVVQTRMLCQSLKFVEFLHLMSDRNLQHVTL